MLYQLLCRRLYSRDRQHALVDRMMFWLSAYSCVGFHGGLKVYRIIISRSWLGASMHGMLVNFTEHRSAWGIRQSFTVADTELIIMIQTDHNPFFNSLWHRGLLRLDYCHDF